MARARGRTDGGRRQTLRHFPSCLFLTFPHLLPPPPPKRFLRVLIRRNPPCFLGSTGCLCDPYSIMMSPTSASRRSTWPSSQSPQARFISAKQGSLPCRRFWSFICAFINISTVLFGLKCVFGSARGHCEPDSYYARTVCVLWMGPGRVLRVDAVAVSEYSPESSR